MKPIVVLGMAQPYPEYGCEQVTIVASRILDTIVAFGQIRHNIYQTARRRIPEDCNLHYNCHGYCTVGYFHFHRKVATEIEVSE
jgi:hypothetical protein